jgi:hypothetical protein
MAKKKTATPAAEDHLPPHRRAREDVSKSTLAEHTELASENVIVSQPKKRRSKNQDPGSLGTKVFLRSFQLMEKEYEQCCETSVHLVSEVGGCSFCSRPDPIRVLAISSVGNKRPRIKVRFCRKCLSKAAMDRLNV